MMDVNAAKVDPIVSTNGLVSLYRQIEDRLREEIVKGNFKEGDLIPSEVELAALYGVSQGTVRKAILNLTQQGVFYRKQGKGTFVVFKKKGQERYRNFRFVGGYEPDLMDVGLSFKGMKAMQATEEVATVLGLKKGGRILRLERSGSIGDSACLHTLSFLPLHLYRGLEKYTAEDFKKNTLWKLQEIFFGIQIENREEFISAVNADEKIAKLLKTAPGAPVLRIEVKLSCQNGEAVEYRLTHVHLGLLKFYSRARYNPSLRNLPQR
jgi:GntR family transcriptional regulator